MARRKAADPEDPGLPKVRARVILQHKAALLVARAAKDEASIEHARLWKAAKKDGIDIDALKAAMKLGQLDPAVAQTLYRNTGLVFEAMYPGVLDQPDLFAGVEPATPAERLDLRCVEIELEGVAAGKAGTTSRGDHRYQPGSAEAQAYERGWLRAADEEFGPVPNPPADHGSNDEPRIVN